MPTETTAQRLIDANALLEIVKKIQDSPFGIPMVLRAIESAPTVDVIKDVVGFVNDWVEENLDEWWSACDYFEDMTKDLKCHFNNV